MKVIRSESRSNDFLQLCAELDKELNERYGKVQEQYDRHNRIKKIETCLIGYLNNSPVGCGCIKSIDNNTAEIKRMFVKSEHRRKGFSSRLLMALEEWASELGFSKVVLETGKGQPEAIRLYEKKGYLRIENYGPYREMENSICMAKEFCNRF